MGTLSAYLVLKYKGRFNRKLFLGLIFLSILWILDYIDFKSINGVLFGRIPSAFIILGCSSYEMDKKIMVPRVLNFLGNASYPYI